MAFELARKKYPHIVIDYLVSKMKVKVGKSGAIVDSERSSELLGSSNAEVKKEFNF